MRDARARIQTAFGAAESKPVVVFFNGTGIGPFKLNGFGSTQTVGSRACVFVGPQGHNVDVVAHELLHGELHHRVGPLYHFLSVPTWFDEGVAMQVDDRSRYRLPPEEALKSDYVRTLRTGSAFFVGDDAALTRNYASAKEVVATWISRIGPMHLYSRLARLKSGESFSTVVPDQEGSR